MNANIILKEPVIFITNKTVETSNFLTDPTFIISAITLLITLSALCFSVVIFRPKIHIELKNVLFKELLRSYEIVVSNNGNVMAEDIKIEFDESLKNALNYNCPEKDNDGFGGFKFIENNLNKKFKYLPAKKEVKGLFVKTKNNDENTSPLLFDVKFTVYVTYKNSITKWKYKKQPIILELKKSDWITEYNMTDNLGYDLKLLLEELKAIKNISININENLYEVAYNIESEKVHNAKEVFKSLNKKEKELILEILGKKHTPSDYQFVNNLKNYIKKSNNSISKKLTKLKLDEYDFFMTLFRNFRDGV